MTELLFLRHAETDLAGTFCGHSDPLVNQRGREQIEQVVYTLQSTAIDRIYSSDLQRARATAERMADAFEVPVIATSALREIDFGAWEALRWSDIEARDPVYANRWLAEYPNLPAPAGECFADFRSRVLAAVAEIAAEIASAGHGRAAVVTHGGAMRVVLQELCGVPAHRAWALTKPFCASFTYRPPVLQEATR